MPEAGWYDDPENAGQLRWWDGSRWTEQRQPRMDAEDTPPPPPVPGSAVGPASMPSSRGVPARPARPVRGSVARRVAVATGWRAVRR